MKVLFWGKGKQSLNEKIEGILTAENAQKIADAALEVKTARLGQIVYDFALQSIKEASERAEYSLWYGLYTNGPIASEIRGDELTATQNKKNRRFCSRKTCRTWV